MQHSPKYDGVLVMYIALHELTTAGPGPFTVLVQLEEANHDIFYKKRHKIIANCLSFIYISLYIISLEPKPNKIV